MTNTHQNNTTPNKLSYIYICGGQLIPYVQIASEKPGPNI